jgi:hypothetical protein
MDILQGGVVSTSTNPQAGGPPLVGCPRLLIKFIRSYPTLPNLHHFIESKHKPLCTVQTKIQELKSELLKSYLKKYLSFLMPLTLSNIKQP